MQKLIMLGMITLIVTNVHSVAAQNSQPYAGQQTRQIKALSASEVEGLLAGKGLGMAKPAELNQYPGPKHVLEVVEQLDLTAQQIQQTRLFFKQMQAEAIPLGEQIVAAEKKLDELFASGRVTNKDLEKALDEIAKLRGRLRFVHLKTHLRQKAIMSAEQVHRYIQLRGYGPQHQHQH